MKKIYTTSFELTLYFSPYKLNRLLCLSTDTTLTIDCISVREYKFCLLNMLNFVSVEPKHRIVVFYSSEVNITSKSNMVI